MLNKCFLALSSVAVMLTSFCACQNSDDNVIVTPITEISQKTYAISAEEALSSLYNFLISNSTRTGDSLPRIMNIIPMKLKNVTIRAMATMDAENVIYVANFSNDNAFAVFAADDRIQDRVIAVTDKSNITKEDIDAVASFFKNNETYTDADYTTTGNDLFTIDDSSGKFFLNPDTFSTYDETLDNNGTGKFSKEVT